MRLAFGETSLADLTHMVQTALGLLDSETADQIIGEQTDEYRKLIQGANALVAIDWAVKKAQYGLRETSRSLSDGAKTLAMVLTLVHYAYALGMRRGREE